MRYCEYLYFDQVKENETTKFHDEHNVHESAIVISVI